MSLGHSVAGGGNSTCKGPELGKCLAHVHGTGYEYGERCESSRGEAEREQSQTTSGLMATMRTHASSVSEEGSHWKVCGRCLF